MKIIVLTPRFEGSDFAGYHQVSGNTLDTDGHLYPMIHLEEYNKMRDEKEATIMELETALIMNLDNAECRGDEDCDHCYGRKVLNDLSNPHTSQTSIKDKE